MTRRPAGEKYALDGGPAETNTRETENRPRPIRMRVGPPGQPVAAYGVSGSAGQPGRIEVCGLGS